jgi:hypothetical protein
VISQLFLLIASMFDGNLRLPYMVFLEHPMACGRRPRPTGNAIILAVTNFTRLVRLDGATGQSFSAISIGVLAVRMQNSLTALTAQRLHPSLHCLLPSYINVGQPATRCHSWTGTVLRR